jgi:23S rRNA (cytidine1920-2'-O)/16S rRNA (cytidine1409-2'-O)-methyltransferase
VRQRLDRELAARGLARSRSHAQTMINSGSVSVDGVVVSRPAELVESTAQIDADADHYVSRAAHKLLGALDDLRLSVAGRRALDAGSSTGGFTQVLLERGCSQVIAIDVGTDQLAPELRRDPRVREWERTNLRDLGVEHVDRRPVDLVVADVSFISLVMLIERFTSVVAPTGQMLVMIKPQFEVGREQLGKGGVVREPALHRQAVDQVVAEARRCGWQLLATVPSRLLGPAGNQEFFALFARQSL